MTDWIGWVLVMHGPWRITCNADHWLGCWCLPRAGAWAYRDVDGEEADHPVGVNKLITDT